MGKTLFNIIKTTRPRQFIKNVVLFTAIVFNGWFFLPDKFLPVLMASFVFIILSSSVYIFNDIVDINKDRLHPLKRKRPIASGALPIPIAVLALTFLLTISLIMSLAMSQIFFIICLAYLFLHIAYSLLLKQLPIIDVMTIASGFILRVYAGAAVINAHINVWLLLCIISFSLFLAIGKRRSELTLLAQAQAGKHRQVLFSYPEKLLDTYVSMFANTTWLTYAFFTFLQPGKTINSPKIIDLISYLPKTFTVQKLLMLTVPMVIFAVMRYLWIIYQKGEGGSPEKVLLTDKQLLGAVLLWAITVMMIIYGVG